MLKEILYFLKTKKKKLVKNKNKKKVNGLKKNHRNLDKKKDIYNFNLHYKLLIR